jgi:hypothetical protein
MIVALRIVDDLGSLLETRRAPAAIAGAQVGDSVVMGERRLLVVAREWTLSAEADLTVTARQEGAENPAIAEVHP